MNAPRPGELLPSFVERAVAQTKEAFAKEFAATPLLVQLTEPEVADSKGPTARFGTIIIRKEEMASGDAKMFVHPLRKQSANAFGMMITVGRTSNNDVVLPYEAISKFHAYFSQLPDGSWSLTDAKSMNGTFVWGKRLGPDTKEKLDLSRPVDVSFSQAIECRLYSAAAFWDFASATRFKKSPPSKPRP
jgi:hypothetical protein